MKREEALKILRETHDSALFSVRTALETLIPELAESEDERVRKNCIHFLEYQKSHHADTREIEECIAWLEKQKVNHVVEWSAYDKATLDYIIEDIEQLYDEAYSAEDTDAYERELNLLRSIRDSVKLSRYTNPAEWSEDERIRKEIYNFD